MWPAELPIKVDLSSLKAEDFQGRSPVPFTAPALKRVAARYRIKYAVAELAPE